MWGLRGWALFHARPLVLGACGRGPLFTGCGCGGCGCGDLSSSPQRALLRAGFAPCGGVKRAPREGAPLACMWGVRGWALSPGPPPFLGACGRGQLPIGSGCAGCGRGDPSPTPQRALSRAGFARCGGGTRAPRGRRLLPGCGAFGAGRSCTPDRPSLARAAGARYPLAVGAGAVGLGTCHRLQSARSCGLALHAVWAAGGCVGGVPLAFVWGVRVRALFQAPPPVLGACGRGPLPTGCACEGVGVGTRHQPRSSRSCEPALRAVGAAQGRPGGGASCLDVGRPESGARPCPTAHLLGRAAGGHYPVPMGAGGVDVGTRHQPHSARSLRWLCALWGRHEGAWGARLLPGCGASGVGRFSTHNCPSLGLAAGASYPLVVGAGGSGVGTCHQPHSARCCVLALRAVVAARVPKGGAALAWMWGVRGWALFHAPPPVLRGCGQGPATHSLWASGVLDWGPVTNPAARALASWLCALSGCHKGARGGGRLVP